MIATGDNSMEGNEKERIPAPATIHSRRATLERQSSFEKLHAGTDTFAAKFDPIRSASTGSNASLSSRHLSSTGQSADDNVFGLPKAPPPLQNAESVESSQSPSGDAFLSASITSSSTPASVIPLSKAGRKRKHPMKPGRHVCQYCGRACAKPSVLEKHIRMHTGERPFPCNVCDLSFKTKSNLYKHRKSFTHTQKCHEKGFSIGSTQGESFGSSRDESMEIADGDLDEDVSQLSVAAPNSCSSSVGSSTSLDCQQFKGAERLMPGVRSSSPKLDSYLDTLRHLERVYDAVDVYVAKKNLVVAKRAHFLLDRDCVVSIQLQCQRKTSDLEKPVTDLNAGIPSKAADIPPASLQPAASKENKAEFDMRFRINQLLKVNEEIISNSHNEIPRRRLSRQSSVSSPATRMFTSNEPPASTTPSTVAQLIRSGATAGSVTISTPSTSTLSTSTLSAALPSASVALSTNAVPSVTVISSSTVPPVPSASIASAPMLSTTAPSHAIPETAKSSVTASSVTASSETIPSSTMLPSTTIPSVTVPPDSSSLANVVSETVPSAYLLDGEELLSSIREIIQSSANIDPNIKLLLHKHCMELKLKLLIPDMITRRKWGTSQSTEVVLSADKLGSLNAPASSGFSCPRCKTVFSRQHVLEIHFDFYCYGESHASAQGPRPSAKSLAAHSFDELPISDDRRRLKLLKTGSEDSSFTYLIADDHANQHEYNRSKSDMPLADRTLMLRQQHSSTETMASEGVSTKQHLKNHVLKHMSHGSLGADTNSMGTALNNNSFSMSLDESQNGLRPKLEKNKSLTSRNSSSPLSQTVTPPININGVPLTAHSNLPASQTMTPSRGGDSRMLPVSEQQEPAVHADIRPHIARSEPLLNHKPHQRQASMEGRMLGVAVNGNPTPSTTSLTLSTPHPVTWPTPVVLGPIVTDTVRGASVAPTVSITAASLAAVTAVEHGNLSPLVHRATRSPISLTKVCSPQISPLAKPNKKIARKFELHSSTPETFNQQQVKTKLKDIGKQLSGGKCVESVTFTQEEIQSITAQAHYPTISKSASFDLHKQLTPSVHISGIHTDSPIIHGVVLAPAPVPPQVAPPKITLPQIVQPKAASPQIVQPKVASPQVATTDLQRIGLLRRRFSQTRSKHSVSFDESTVTGSQKLGVSSTSTADTTQSTRVSTYPSHELAQRLTTDVKLASIINMRVGTEFPHKQVSAIPHSISAAASSTALSLTSYHPITFQLFISHQTSKRVGELTTHRNDQVVNRQTLSVECRPSYCTMHRRSPSHAVLVTPASNYAVWMPFKAAQPTSQWVDMTVPISCYNSKQTTDSNQYKNSGMDTRSIFTHSSYWQYKNKMRVMHSMPSQISTSQLPTSESVPSSETKSEPKPAVTSAPAPRPEKLPLPIIEGFVDSKGTLINNNTRPSVITRDVQLNKKKMLHRSQSTPNAGGDSQSKLIAGGFKSDEAYVYIRGRGKGKYVCQQCGIRCRKPSMLKKHIRTHTDLRPYSCKHCSFSFKTKGNLTKHMRSKAHHRRCLELNIIPVPSSVDDSQIDQEILASQQKLSRDSKIKGSTLTDDEREAEEGSDEGSDDGSDDDEDDNSTDDNSSADDTLLIDEDMADNGDTKSDGGDVSPTLPLNSAALRRVHSMPAHHMANSFDASSLSEMLPEEPEPKALNIATPPPTKKRKKNHLNLTITTTRTKQEGGALSSSKIEDDIAMSLLDLSKTPVHGTPTPKPLIGQSYPLSHTPETATLPSTHTYDKVATPSSAAITAAGVKRVSVVRSTKPTVTDHKPAVTESNDEPMDLRVQMKPAQLNFICPLCRAICNNQEGLNAHMKLHDGPVIEVPNRSAKRMLSQASSVGSFDKDFGYKQSKPHTPQTPNLLRRQHAINIFDSDVEEEEIDYQTKVEPGEKLNDKILKRKCPYCPKIFLDEGYVPLHVKSHHLITQEYVCTYKDCGDKFTNRQDLTYHLGTHALDDNDKYQPISIPKCGICEKTFKSTSSLKQHIQHHSEARPHVCEYCDAGFTTAQSLKHHLKTHTQERPYVCGECGSTFARSDHLTQHSKTHRKHLHPSASEVHGRGTEPPTILNPSGNVSTLRH